jgi:hypothetical protein
MSYAVVRLSDLSVQHPLPPTAAPKDSEFSAAGAATEPTSSRSGLGGCPLRILVNSPDTGNRCVPVLSLSLSLSLSSLCPFLCLSLSAYVCGDGGCVPPAVHWVCRAAEPRLSGRWRPRLAASCSARPPWTCCRTPTAAAVRRSLRFCLAAVLTEMYLCGVCPWQDILRRHGRGQAACFRGAWTARR